MYLFTDSIDFRLTVFTLAHIGKDFPESNKDLNLSSEIIPDQCKKAVCVSGNCIDECSCQKKESIESVDTKFVDKRRAASIIVEDYDWTSRQTGQTSMFLKTYGTSSLFFNFAKGRHVKRIWMNAEPVFCLHIFSDDPNIKIGRSDEILECMAMESELLTKKCYEISSAFGNMVRDFATPEYPKSLRAFYKSYLPEDVQLSKKNAARIHNCFMNELKAILADSFSELYHNDLSRTIRILFLDPDFRIPYTADFNQFVQTDVVSIILNNPCPCRNTRERTDKEKEMAAIKIQSVFKMYHMKRMKDIHQINNNNFPSIIELSKSIYIDIFSAKNKDLQCIKIVRGMLFNEDIKDLVENFTFFKDLKSVIDLKLFSGDANEMKQIRCTPFLKRCFYFYDDEVYMRPYIFSTIPTYIVRVFDNDTGDEIDRYTNNTLVHKYVKNKKGYTIFAYGLSNQGIHVKTHSWKLLIVSEKILVASSIEIDQQSNSMLQLDGIYLPNLENVITKIILKINSNCRGTFYLQTSSETARLKMECITAEGNIIAEAYGLSSVMIPFVHMEIEPDDSTNQETSSVDKNAKLKKNKSQRRVSNKSISMRDKKKWDKDSVLSISKKRSIAEQRFSYDYKEFFIRVILLENSWPLNTTEWNFVNAVRAQSNVEPELFFNKASLNKGSLGGLKKP